MQKDTQFFIFIDGNEAGPFTLDNIMRQGITPDTLVWFQGQPNWTKAGDIPELKALLDRERNSPQQPAPDTDNTARQIQDLQARLTELEKKLAEKEAITPTTASSQSQEEWKPVTFPQPADESPATTPPVAAPPVAAPPKNNDDSGCLGATAIATLFIVIGALVLLALIVHNCDNTARTHYDDYDTVATEAPVEFYSDDVYNTVPAQEEPAEAVTVDDEYDYEAVPK